MLGRALEVLAERGIDLEAVAIDARLAPDVVALITGADERPELVL